MRWERDQHGRPLKHSFGRKDKERNREYTWEVDDRLKKIVDSAYGPVEFEHDAFGNLSGATYNDFHKLWRAPDVLGNLFRTPERLDRKYGPSGQLMESTSTQGLTRYEYDAEGNLVKKTITPPHSPEPTMVLGSGTGLGSGPNADKIWLYEWNAAGHLSRLVRPDGQSVEFLYDPLGRRVAKTFAGRTTRWVWDGNLPLHEWQEETGIALDVEPPPAYEMDARLAEVLQLLRDKTLSPLSPQGPPPRPSEQCPITWLFEPDSFAPLARLQGERRESIVCDHLGTPLAMFNDAGDQTWSLDLDIYGQPRMVEGERGLCPFRYPGQYEDAVTGLYYNRFRYFDPEAGGYISQDPIRLGSHVYNLYVYTKSPNTITDPYGLDWNYVLFNSQNQPYYSGRASDNQSMADVGRRHGANVGTDGPRFGSGDTMRRVTPVGSDKDLVRGIEERPTLGRGSPNRRGNLIDGISERKRGTQKGKNRLARADNHLTGKKSANYLLSKS